MKKMFLMAIGALFLLFSLFGCGGGGGASSASNTPADTAAKGTVNLSIAYAQQGSNAPATKAAKTAVSKSVALAASSNQSLIDQYKGRVKNLSVSFSQNSVEKYHFDLAVANGVISSPSVQVAPGTYQMDIQASNGKVVLFSGVVPVTVVAAQTTDATVNLAQNATVPVGMTFKTMPASLTNGQYQVSWRTMYGDQTVELGSSTGTVTGGNLSFTFNAPTTLETFRLIYQLKDGAGVNIAQIVDNANVVTMIDQLAASQPVEVVFQAADLVAIGITFPTEPAVTTLSISATSGTSIKLANVDKFFGVSAWNRISGEPNWVIQITDSVGVLPSKLVFTADLINRTAESQKFAMATGEKVLLKLRAINSVTAEELAPALDVNNAAIASWIVFDGSGNKRIGFQWDGTNAVALGAGAFKRQPVFEFSAGTLAIKSYYLSAGVNTTSIATVTATLRSGGVATDHVLTTDWTAGVNTFWTGLVDGAYVLNFKVTDNASLVTWPAWYSLVAENSPQAITLTKVGGTTEKAGLVIIKGGVLVDPVVSDKAAILAAAGAGYTDVTFVAAP